MSSELKGAKSLVKVLGSRVIEDTGDDLLRESVKDQLLRSLEYLSPADLEEILKDFQEILISIDALPTRNQIAISLLISKSETLTFIGIIYGKLKQYDFALEHLEEAATAEKIASAFVSAETDWHFLRIQLNAEIAPNQNIIERLKLNLPVLIDYYKEIGNEESRIAVRNELWKVNSLEVKKSLKE